MLYKRHTPDLQYHPLQDDTRRLTPLLSPALLAALSELAATEHLPVATLVALLINEALTVRLHRKRP